MDVKDRLPVHVGVIMDGNGRWAKKRLLPRTYGHRAGMERMIDIAGHAANLGIKYLTVYVLSTENLSRPEDELEGLFGLVRKFFKSNIKKLYAKNSGIKVIGDLSGLPKDVSELLENGVKNSPDNARFHLVFAINYGGRAEIVNAVNRAIERGAAVTEREFAALLYTGGMPDPDLIIRTGGEVRLSNFLMYQAAYSELYFTDVLFPDFTCEEFDKALKSYAGRDRRFGKVKS